MNQTLIARLENLSQYNAEKKTVIYRHDREAIWEREFRRLVVADKGLFLSDGKVLVGEITDIKENKSINFENVREHQIGNDDLLRINSIEPEINAKIKASFKPFVINLNITEIENEIESQSLISFHVIVKNELSNLSNIYKQNDRIVLLDESLKMTSLNIFREGSVQQFAINNGLFLSKGRSLTELEKVQLSAGKSRTAASIKTISKAIKQRRYFTFPTFNSYYNIIHNKRLYSKLPLVPGVDSQSNSDKIFLSTNKVIPLTSSLNTILYGPPGTGKTYKTISKAASIVTGENYEGPEAYEHAKNIFRTELGKQIEFVTFHQNYSYEDFVAGLRPDIEAASVGLRFVEHRGIFYKVCQRARENYEQFASGQTFVEPTFEEVLEVFLQPLIDDEEIKISTIARNVSFHITANNVKNLSFRKQGGGTQHTLSLSTMKDLYHGRREYNLQGLGIYFRPVVDKLKQIAAGLRKETGKIALKNYVLIIDEINRANISRVFGELITLLEPDKRLGAPNELRLRLPGLPDEELFCVPPNLYIIGTMNTADKSIALIDIALRRRFVFQPMYPDYTLVDSPYKEFLQSLNDQILEKKNADFLIGHSYLMANEGEELDFVSALNYKIIPLLNEYFYNHRNVSVLALLKIAIAKVPGYEMVFDKYTGAICNKLT